MKPRANRKTLQFALRGRGTLWMAQWSHSWPKYFLWMAQWSHSWPEDFRWYCNSVPHAQRRPCGKGVEAMSSLGYEDSLAGRLIKRQLRFNGQLQWFSSDQPCGTGVPPDGHSTSAGMAAPAAVSITCVPPLAVRSGVPAGVFPCWGGHPCCSVDY